MLCSWWSVQLRTMLRCCCCASVLHGLRLFRKKCFGWMGLRHATRVYSCMRLHHTRFDQRMLAQPSTLKHKIPASEVPKISHCRPAPVPRRRFHRPAPCDISYGGLVVHNAAGRARGSPCHCSAGGEPHPEKIRDPPSKQIRQNWPELKSSQIIAGLSYPQPERFPFEEKRSQPLHQHALVPSALRYALGDGHHRLLQRVPAVETRSKRRTTLGTEMH